MKSLIERLDEQQRKVDTMNLTDEELNLIRQYRQRTLICALTGVLLGSIAGYLMCMRQHAELGDVV